MVLEVVLGHHEVAQGQHELGVVFGDLIEAADNVQKLKYVIKMVAHLNGKSATFMPKPLYGDNGNGMHVHQSIWKDGKTYSINKVNMEIFLKWLDIILVVYLNTLEQLLHLLIHQLTLTKD